MFDSPYISGTNKIIVLVNLLTYYVFIYNSNRAMTRRLIFVQAYFVCIVLYVKSFSSFAYLKYQFVLLNMFLDIKFPNLQ